jgi:hypothetical protein
MSSSHSTRAARLLFPSASGVFADDSRNWTRAARRAARVVLFHAYVEYLNTSVGRGAFCPAAHYLNCRFPSVIGGVRVLLSARQRDSLCGIGGLNPPARPNQSNF